MQKVHLSAEDNPKGKPLIHCTRRLVENARHTARKGYPDELREAFRSLHARNPEAMSQEIDNIFAEYVAPSKNFSAGTVRKEVPEACWEP